MHLCNISIISRTVSHRWSLIQSPSRNMCPVFHWALIGLSFLEGRHVDHTLNIWEITALCIWDVYVEYCHFGNFNFWISQPPHPEWSLPMCMGVWFHPQSQHWSYSLGLGYISYMLRKMIKGFNADLLRALIEPFTGFRRGRKKKKRNTLMFIYGMRHVFRCKAWSS